MKYQKHIRTLGATRGVLTRLQLGVHLIKAHDPGTQIGNRDQVSGTAIAVLPLG